MPRMITLLLTAGFFLTLFSTGSPSRADGCDVRTAMRGREGAFVPSVTWYAPYPYWWPQYFGPPHTDYQVVQYWTPPAESAQIVKERILAINAANPAMLPPAKEPLPFPKPDSKDDAPSDKKEDARQLP